VVLIDSHTTENEMSYVIVPPSNLHEDFREMLSIVKRVDITFTMDGQLFHAHRCALSFCSPVFRAELFSPMREKPKISL